nr:PREDICTED: ankyrin repeat domain-containing protein 53-like isoform X1 [Paralichthys olivaceus]XP_019967715.1 PREDICTED: ankyrin repeat domain-containing protein 53-like isoform X1 [Paralichthys olivaceus]
MLSVKAFDHLSQREHDLLQPLLMSSVVLVLFLLRLRSVEKSLLVIIALSLVFAQGLSALHMACLYGQLGPLRVLVKTTLDELDSSDPQGRRPIHMVMSSQSSPKSAACLRFLLENGADISVTTDSGQTPLHHAAAAGLLDCVEILVQAGADVMAQDDMGHTPLDLARVWSHRDVGRYLRGCVWLAEKKREMEERKQVRVLYRDLVAEAKLNELNKRILIDRKMNEWAAKKGLPNIKASSPKVMVSQYHTKCLSSDHDTSNVGLRKLKPRPRESRPDLHDSVMVWTDSSGGGRPQYITKWESMPRYAPDVPLDILKRVLFPMASRIKSPQDFKARVIEEVTHRRCPQGTSRSPWTEVPEHLVEVLEPGCER